MTVIMIWICSVKSNGPQAVYNTYNDLDTVSVKSNEPQVIYNSYNDPQAVYIELMWPDTLF